MAYLYFRTLTEEVKSLFGVR